VRLCNSKLQVPDKTFILLDTVLCAKESDAVLKCKSNEETISTETATVTVLVETFA
jgi:hypothetical protein